MPTITLTKENSTFENALKQLTFFEKLKANDMFVIENNLNGVAVDLRAKYFNFCISYLSEFDLQHETINIESSTFSAKTENLLWEQASSDLLAFNFNPTVGETVTVFEKFTKLLEELALSNDRLCIGVYSPAIFGNKTEEFLLSENVGGKKLNVTNQKDYSIFHIPNSSLEKYKKIIDELDDSFVSYKFFDRKLEGLREEVVAG